MKTKKIITTFILVAIMFAGFEYASAQGVFMDVDGRPDVNNGSSVNLQGAPTNGPSYTSASCSGRNIRELADIFNWGTCVINKSILPLLISVAILMFIFGVIKFIGNADNEEKRNEGKNFIIFSIIAIFAIISIWGLVAVLGKTFGVQNVIPQLQTR